MPISSFGFVSTYTGSAPSPFDALDGPRLAGPQGAHPLHDVRMDELVRPTDGPITGEFTLAHPVRVGEEITGTVRLTAAEALSARAAHLRLVGLRLVEEQKSREERDREGRVVRSEHWVEVDGKLFEELPFLEPPIPTTLAPGQTWEATFSLPAPRLGPPSAHLGEAIVTWALEIRWDIPHAPDHFVALHLGVLQHPDLIRAGVGQQGGASLLGSVDVGGGTISVTSPLPAPAGSELVVRPAWPGAPGGGEVRIELHRRTNAPNAVEGIIASTTVPAETLSSGSAEARLAIPAGSAPSFDGAGLKVDYIVRVLVNRRFRPDAAIERFVAVY